MAAFNMFALNQALLAEQMQQAQLFGGGPPRPQRRGLSQFLFPERPRPRPRDRANSMFAGHAHHDPRFGRAGRGEILVPGYEFIKSLGKGGMSEAVSLVRHVRTGKVCVEKRVNINRAPMMRKRVEAEIRALKLVQKYENLSTILEYEWKERAGLVGIVLAYENQGSLGQAIDDMTRTGEMFGEAQVYHVLLGVAKGLAFIHHGIRDVKRDMPKRRWDTTCHLDLKPDNIFFTSSGQDAQLWRVVLGDFGCAVTQSDVILGREHPWLQQCGTPEWYPPEGRVDMAPAGRTQYGTETDIWQLGATIHTMCRLLKVPNRRQLWSNDPCGRAYGNSLVTMVSACCSNDYRMRPTAHQLARQVMKKVQRG